MSAKAAYPPATSFNAFLYASVGDDKNGMVLTVLSAFARQDVDPWEQAADLSRLSPGLAVRKLAEMFESVPGLSSPADRANLAGRLVALLPPGVDGANRAYARPHDPPTAARPPLAAIVSMILLYGALMCMGEWLSLGMSASIPAESSADRGSTPGATQ